MALCLCIFLSFLGNDFSIEKNISLVADTSEIYLTTIKIEGNKVTKESIIRRELDVKEGDRLPLEKLDTIAFRNKNKIFNTDLFITVDISWQIDSLQNAVMLIELKERWYTFPVPIFELADRNFNEWWRERGADLRRTNFGLRFVQKNVRGRNETLEFLIQYGFVQKFTFDYKIPYIDALQKHGLEFGGSYVQNKNLAYETENHKLEFIEGEEVYQEKYEAKLSFTKRNAFYSFHRLEGKFHFNSIADTVVEINPNFFAANQTEQRFLSLKYEFRRDLRDIVAYPLRGNAFKFTLQKQGIGIFNDLDIWNFSTNYSVFKEINKVLFADFALFGRVSILNNQPYSNAQGLGYNDEFLRGFELYVIDGQTYFLSKNTLKFQLLNTVQEFKFIPIEQFRTVPIAMYLTGYFDTGYINDRFFTDASNRFSNRLIYGFGLGLDVVTYYNAVIKFNYSINSASESGFFINFSGSF